ncbi:MAG: sterol carrier protein domain-containing protein, partial [Candidatus Thorarchaeota archaeon]
CVNLLFLEKSTGKELHMLNTYFSSNDILPTILKFVGTHASEVSKVVWNCSSRIPVRSMFQHVYSLSTTIDGAMMMRVVDFRRYVKSIKVREELDLILTLKIIDNECPWNEGLYRISCHDGSISIEDVDAMALPDLILTPNELSRIVGGTEAPSVLQTMGLINCDFSIAEKLDALFPQDSFISHFRF